MTSIARRRPNAARHPWPMLAGWQRVRAWSFRSYRSARSVNPNFRQILAWSVLSAPQWVAGGIVDADAWRWMLWLGALGLDLAGPLITYFNNARARAITADAGSQQPDRRHRGGSPLETLLPADEAIAIADGGGPAERP
jgi:hypothetical protein